MVYLNPFKNKLNLKILPSPLSITDKYFQIGDYQAYACTKLKENGLGYIDPIQNRMVTLHDLRSIFRDWSADKTDYPREVCKHVLAHKLPDEVEAVYLRGAYLEKRKRLMNECAEFCVT